VEPRLGNLGWDLLGGSYTELVRGLARPGHCCREAAGKGEKSDLGGGVEGWGTGVQPQKGPGDR
jgi:hypothetical protein